MDSNDDLLDHLHHLRWLAKDLRIELMLRRLRIKYSPNQPRVPAGTAGGGQWTSSEGGSTSPTRLSGTVIRICVAGSRSLTTDRFGNKSYWVEYECAGGQSFIERGLGHQFRGFVIDPFN